MSPGNIIAGFRTCGVYPFNPSAISATPHTEHADDTGTSVAPNAWIIGVRRPCVEARLPGV